MRIGSLSSMNFSKWDPSGQRDVVTKHVPSYVAPASFDLYSQADTLAIDGTLVGTSTSNLASQMETLRAMFRNRLTVWIDATDAYPQLLEFCRITKLSGPTVDYSKGPLIAVFSLEAQVLLPWGTVLMNPWSTSPGVYFRDLSGVGKEYVLNPLAMNCNYQIDNTNLKFSCEFIVDNQNLYNNATLINACDSTTGFSQNWGTGGTLSVDSIHYKQGSGSVKLTGTSDSGGNFGSALTTSATSVTSFDFFEIWARGDFGGNSTGQVWIYLQSSSGNYRYWTYSNVTNHVWTRFVVPINANYGTVGTPNMSSITLWGANFVGAASSTSNCWVDDMNVDLGLWQSVEVMVPDNVSQSQVGNAVQLYSWNPGTSAYVEACHSDYAGSGASNNPNYFLDGTLSYPMYGQTDNGYISIFAEQQLGQSASSHFGNAKNNPITYTSSWGTQYRIAFQVKMPPATSDSAAGNLPSDDLSGFQAINKARFELLVYYANEDTSYAGY